jgi:glucose/arabinose dehydrogenase
MKNFITLINNLLILSIVLITSTANLFSQTYPAGFSQSNTVTGLSNPTAMAFAPDGRVFICQQGGSLRVVKEGALLPTPFISLTVSSSGERGLLGVAFDPDFAINQYIYFYYTTSGAPIHNRVSRFTADGDVALAGSELILADLDDLSGATNHNGGSIAFGSDGMLYIAVGDNANSAHPQTLANRHGKILRINSDGTIPADNPTSYAGITGSPAGANQAIWSVGLRNPFTIAFQPVSGKLFVNDVGQSSKEEINENTLGSLNFGWPATEGKFDEIAFPNYTNPIYNYGRSGSANTNGLGCAITGGTFFNPTTSNYPAQYTGDYFFIDFCGRWIDKLTLSQSVPVAGAKPNADVWTRTGFASSISGGPVDLKVGPDGNIYYLSRNNGTLVQVTYTAPALPINLLYFNAKTTDNELVELNWATSSESNSDKFEIEKSEDSKLWNTIGEVKASGNSSEKKDYKFEDAAQKAGMNYYRLKQFDLDGKFKYSKIECLFIELGESNIKLYPNPAQNIVEIKGINIEKEVVEIFNNLGQNVTKKVTFKSQSINVSSLPKGKYFMKTSKKTLPFYKN